MEVLTWSQHHTTAAMPVGLLSLYAYHAVSPSEPNHLPGLFALTKLRGWDMTDDVDSFRHAARIERIRNPPGVPPDHTV